MSQIRFETVDVNAALATEYLKRNIVNRILSKQVVDRYARDMIHGNWELTGDAIRFDMNGDLVDGQHRLNAIIKSNTSIKMTIAYGIEQSGTIDSGYKRNDAANFQIKYGDNKFNNRVQADLTLIASVFGGISKLTISEHKKLYDYLYDELCFMESLPNIKSTCATLRGACMVAIKKFGVSKSKIERFVEIFNSGYSTNESENQAVALRNEYIKHKAEWNRGRQARVSAFKQTLSSILGFVKGNTGKRIARVLEFEYPEIKELLK